MNYIKNKSKQKILAAIIATLLIASVSIAIVPPTLAISGPALSASSGNAGATPTVSGTDAQPGSLVIIYWENINPINFLATVFADGTGAYSQQVTIPTAPAGVHYIIVQDLSGTAATAFTIVPEIVLTPTLGIANDTVAVAGTGFAASANITLTFDGTPLMTAPETVVTDSRGSFTAAFEVPSEPYGNYTVEASDSVNSASAAFTIGASIALDSTEGPAGSVVSISGRGFSSTAGTNVTVSIGSSTAPEVLPIETLADGTFSGQIIIPTLPVGSYMISASDGVVSASAAFNVTGTTGITLTPKSGAPGVQVVEISGANFTAIPHTTVTVQIGPLILGRYSTDANGAFTGTFIVPSLYPGVYTVTAQDANGLNASADFQIALTELAVTPTSGATGSTVTVIGYGFTGETANVTIGGTQVLTSINVGTLLGGATFVVPTLPVGKYTVTAIDDDGLTASTVFKVTATTEVILNPASTSPDTVVNVTAVNFQPDSALTFTLRNSTWSTNLTVTPAAGFSGTTTNATGAYIGTFEVPLTWAFGKYTLNVTGANGLTVEVPFKVSPLPVTVNTRSLQYTQGETGSFLVVSPLNATGSITITDPDGYSFDPLPIVWTKVGTVYVDAYLTFQLPDDAPVGTWTWTATFTSHGGYTATGSFTVVSAAPNNNSSEDSTDDAGTPGASGSDDSTGSTGSTGSTDTAGTTGSQGSAASAGSTGTPDANGPKAETPKVETDTPNAAETTKADLIDTASTAETAAPLKESAVGSATVSIAFAALTVGSIAGVIALALRRKGIKPAALAQSLLRCQHLLKRMAYDAAHAKKSVVH
jgi:hypothetical protein